MTFKPLERMMQRVATNGDSDPLLFHELLYAGEYITKLAVAALVASIQDEKENHRYRLIHTLIRADGIGQWASVLDEICTGTASRHIHTSYLDTVRTITRRVTQGDWQHRAVTKLQNALVGLNSENVTLGKKIYLRSWFTKFAELRNKTRGHGSPTPAACAAIVQDLMDSITAMIENLPIFQAPWAFLHQNLSGRYNVATIGGDTSCFSYLKTAAAHNTKNYLDGVYLWIGEPKLVELLHSDLDVTDFFVPNGAFNGKTYELHSPITDDRRQGDADRYSAIPTGRPVSETEGMAELDIVGNTYANLPARPSGYIRRVRLEDELLESLRDERHPIVTLVGRGGIGKTSLALALLYEIAEMDAFDVMVWFSARDIDLTGTGPKVVQPQTLTDREIAEEYESLIGAA